LDFAQARYYSNQHGRFTTVDPLMASAVVTVTQSWNRYTYALNNPLKYVDPTGEAFKDLTEEQLRVFQTYADKQNEGRETALSAEEIYNSLSESQQTTFESATHALENSLLTDQKGNPITDSNGKQLNALNLVSDLRAISGEIEGEKDGRKQFRLLVDLKEGSIATLRKSREFDRARSGHVYIDGKVLDDKTVGTFRQDDGPPGIQISHINYGDNTVDIDVDYRAKTSFSPTKGFRHLDKTNSDVRHGENLRRHNERYGKENPLRNIPQN